MKASLVVRTALSLCVVLASVATAAQSAAADSLKREADLSFARHDYPRAAGLYRELYAADTTDAGLAALLASCLMRDGQFQEATGLYDKALALNPELKLCQLGLVNCYYQLDRIEDAARWATQVRSGLQGAQLADWDRLVAQMYPRIAKREKK